MKRSIGVGHSLLKDSAKAGREALRLALENCGESKAQFVLLFATAGHDHVELIRSVREVSEGTPVAGCTGEGVAFKGGTSESGFAVTCMVFCSSRISARAYNVEGLKADPTNAGKRVAALLNELPESERKLVFLFPDGLTVNSTRFLKAIDESLKAPVPMIGGLAGDQMQLKQTYQYIDDRVLSDSCTFVALGGAFSFDFIVNHGCTPLGTEKPVTKVQGNVIQEIDGRPAWSVLREYISDAPETLGGREATLICMAERMGKASQSEDAFRIHAPLALLDGGAVMFAAELPAGAPVLMTRRDPKQIVAKAMSGSDVLAKKGDPVAVFQFDCAGRGRMLFGEEVDDVLSAPLQAKFKKDTPWIGFHTYGEITPVNGRTVAHSYTLALCALYEEGK